MKYNPNPPLLLLRRLIRSIEANGFREALVHSWRRLYRSLKNHGLGGTFERAFVKAPVAPELSAVQLPPHSFDILHGTDTGGMVSTAGLHAVSLSVLSSSGYLGSPPSTLRPALAALPIRHDEFSFIDLGCGKGRALFVAAELPFRHVFGVEIVVELASAAKANVSLSPLWKERISVANQDATRFAFPDGPIVLYFYNPFSERVLRRVLANLERELRRSPRAILLVFADIYLNEPVVGSTNGDRHRYQEVMDAIPRFRKISDTTRPLSEGEAALEPSRCTVSRFTVYSADVTR
ncbi:MAG: methyltransferase domain-containing protein [Terracidiphilus sp.]